MEEASRAERRERIIDSDPPARAHPHPAGWECPRERAVLRQLLRAGSGGWHTLFPAAHQRASHSENTALSKPLVLPILLQNAQVYFYFLLRRRGERRALKRLAAPLGFQGDRLGRVACPGLFPGWQGKHPTRQGSPSEGSSACVRPAG